MSIMRVASLILTCVFLAGCPPYVKIYLHNDCDSTIRVETLGAQSNVTTIRAGRAKKIWAGSMDDVCFELSVGSNVRVYSIDPNSGPYTHSTAYGGRLDFHFADDAMYVRSNTGERLEISAGAQCIE